jgi:hypothetical protein
LLRGEGIETNIPEEFLAGIDWQMGTALRGIRLQVSDEDADAARELLEIAPASIEMEPDVEQASPVDTCPRCGSESVVPAPWRNRMKAATFMFPPLILMRPVVTTLFSLHACRACGKQWR